MARGVVAQSRSGRFSSTWWARQVENALEEPFRKGKSPASGPVVRRAKVLARHGAVLTMYRHGTAVAGEVQGSQVDPFLPTLSLPEATEDQKVLLAEEIAARPGAAERIIAGDIPDFIEQLLPLHGEDVRWTCDCPVVEGPCSHVLALGYLFVERLNRDSDWYWQARGLTLADILVERDPLDVYPRAQPSPPVEVNPELSDPQLLDPVAFWRVGGPLPEIPAPLPVPVYHDLDPIQWMTIARALSEDPLDKLQLESEMADVWDMFAGLGDGYSKEEEPSD